MEAWAQEVLDIWQNNRVEYAQAFIDVQLLNEQITTKYTLEDMLQMTDGFIAMMREGLEGSSSDIRDTYMNSMFPAILAGGTSLASVVSQITHNAVTAYALTSKLASEANRERILNFMRTYYGGWNYEIVNIGLAFYAANPPAPAV